MKKILLDTNAYTSCLSGDERVLAAMSAAEIVYISVFVMGELFAGFKGGNRESQNKQLLKRFLQKSTVNILDATGDTSEIFGQVKDSLKRAGTPLPINDVWIASHVIETGSILITYDGHFKKIQGIRIWDYL
jgi:tRNA(fMet)-specific endonuclease VapC